ncbi:exonuclease subunit SbcD [Colwellia echini]|uniref:Nuclease SbcCD subunit D n=1 Tax=Colwellia echini TaxID=1982103 RepID=A0ABY3N0D9_9GAMM|nr:exonuclease subunit SbcD [Colwellia echini]TYK66949.1 exonuclease subunit SbcD [Colwellia echini]
MRIIHTSDWHLGQYFYGKSRANEHQQFLNWLLEQVSLHHVNAIIVAGDIFDTSTPPSYAREMYFDFIAKLHASNCQLIILAGNHDSVAMLAESQSVLASLSTRVITQVIPISIAEEALETVDDEQSQSSNALQQQVFSILDVHGKASAIICAIPFVRPRDVSKSRAGQSAQDKQQSLQQGISDHYQNLYQQALALSVRLAKEQNLPEGEILPIIATGHLTALGVSVSDSKSDSVRDIYIGSLEAFPASAFPPADYIALGHIHRAQKVAKSEHIRYCGSPIPLSFDEASQQKRVLVVDFSSGKLAKVDELAIPCFQPLYMVKSSVDELEVKLQATLTQFKKYQEDSLQTLLVNKAWLDIEIDNGDHLSDLSQRVTELTTDMPFEVLLVRRSKKARQRRQTQFSQQENSTLSELSLAEVFDSRLSLLDWQTDEEIARKSRLKELFAQLSIELSLNVKQENQVKQTENSNAHQKHTQNNTDQKEQKSL